MGFIGEDMLICDKHRCAVCGGEARLDAYIVQSPEFEGSLTTGDDIVMLCDNCRATLRRVRSQSKEQYDVFLSEQGGPYEEARRSILYEKIIDLLCVEFWLRDRSNGGDLVLWDTGGRQIGKLKHIFWLIYPNVFTKVEALSGLNALKNTLHLARSMKICELYRREKSMTRVAEIMGMKATNVQKVLKRQGLNATGEIK